MNREYGAPSYVLDGRFGKKIYSLYALSVSRTVLFINKLLLTMN